MSKISFNCQDEIISSALILNDFQMITTYNSFIRSPAFKILSKKKKKSNWKRISFCNPQLYSITCKCYCESLRYMYAHTKYLQE